MLAASGWQCGKRTRGLRGMPHRGEPAVNGRIHTVVHHRIPVFRRGLVEALEERDHVVDRPPNLEAWAAQPGQRVLITECPDHSTIHQAAELMEHNQELVVIGLIEASDPSLAQVALAADMYPIMTDEEPTQLIAAIDAATRGHVYLDKTIAQSWINSSASTPTSTSIEDEERAWLERLGHGWSVTRLADHAGLSRREMNRRLKDLYSKLGATNQKQALVAATEQGLPTKNP